MQWGCQLADGLFSVFVPIFLTSSQIQILSFWHQLRSSPLMYTSSFVILVSCLLAHYYYYCVTRTRCERSGFLLFSMKGKCLCERRTLYVYIQINVELDLKDGETLCKLKITKPSFIPSWCMKSSLQLDMKLV